MKVLNLRCSRLHSFEGWFGSEQDFQQQSSRGLIECPLCADMDIQKMPSAPRLNLGTHSALGTERSISPSSCDSTAALSPLKSQAVGARQAENCNLDMPNPAAQAAFLKALREVLATTEDVGPRFANEARLMHHGEIEARSIRGQASMRETVDLVEEGIEVMPLPMLSLLKETLQ